MDVIFIEGQLYDHCLQHFHVHCTKLQLCLLWKRTDNYLSMKDFKIIPSEDINQIKQQINVHWSSFSNDSNDALTLFNVSIQFLYKRLKTWRNNKTLQYFSSSITLSKSIHIKHLEFLINFHILEILKSRVWNVLYFVNTFDCLCNCLNW